MIFIALIKIAKNIILAIFSTFSIINLPIDIIRTLYSIICYGSWVVGADVLLIFTGTVVFWWGVKMSIGLAIWVWERLPLT